MHAANFATSTLLVLALLSLACSTPTGAANETRSPRGKWYAHCETCNWCKGSFKSAEAAQEAVTNHNKGIHDWFKVAYYDQVKCP